MFLESSATLDGIRGRISTPLPHLTQRPLHYQPLSSTVTRQVLIPFLSTAVHYFGPSLSLLQLPDEAYDKHMKICTCQLGRNLSSCSSIVTELGHYFRFYCQAAHLLSSMTDAISKSLKSPQQLTFFSTQLTRSLSSRFVAQCISNGLSSLTH